jgi:NTP pyrophosphatase (non-canonical NTP hydrolase)
VNERSFNHLTPAEAERLALLAEECGELVQAIGKVLRHGYGLVSPDDLHGENNLARMESEIADVRAAITLMTVAGDIDADEIQDLSKLKLKNVQKYLHHQTMIAKAPRP